MSPTAISIEAIVLVAVLFAGVKLTGVRVIDAWTQFGDTLQSRSGTIAVLFLCNVGLFFGLLHILHTGDESNAAAIMTATFNAFTGALLVALTTGGTPKPPADTGGK